jgi:hypothetical protein
MRGNSESSISLMGTEERSYPYIEQLVFLTTYFILNYLAALSQERDPLCAGRRDNRTSTLEELSRCRQRWGFGTAGHQRSHLSCLLFILLCIITGDFGLPALAEPTC